jgi:hypothetical protein
MLQSGEQVWGGEPVRASSEAEPHLRGRPALEQGGTSPEAEPRAGTGMGKNSNPHAGMDFFVGRS